MSRRVPSHAFSPRVASPHARTSHVVTPVRHTVFTKSFRQQVAFASPGFVKRHCATHPSFWLKCSRCPRPPRPRLPRHPRASAPLCLRARPVSALGAASYPTAAPDSPCVAPLVSPWFPWAHAARLQSDRRAPPLVVALCSPRTPPHVPCRLGGAHTSSRSALIQVAGTPPRRPQLTWTRWPCVCRN